jgi:hypothetical protein
VTARLPFTQASIVRAVSAARKAGRRVCAIGPDGTVHTDDGGRLDARAVPRPSGQGTIYFIGFDNYVKIGFTADLRRRLGGLQTSCPVALTIYFSLPGSKNDEALFHLKFARQKLKREWFRREGELADFLEQRGAPR